jgi:hypothetical protein
MPRKVAGPFIACDLLAASGCQKKINWLGLFWPGTGPDLNELERDGIVHTRAEESYREKFLRDSSVTESAQKLIAVLAA